jgi:hypothetical protein
MKKLFSVLVLLCWLARPAQSQGRQGPFAGQLEAMKTRYITKRLQLTNEEAQKFWPIYDSYSMEVQQAYFAFRHQPNSSEIVLEESLLNIKKKYSVGFLKAIPPPKINEFFKAEKDFNTFVRNEMIRRQMQHGRPYPASPQPLQPQGP